MISDITSLDTKLSSRISTLSSESITEIINYSSVNNRNHTFFQLMTQQPPIFTKTGHEATTGTIKLDWHYDDIVATATTNTLAQMAFQQNTKNQLVPYINTVVFEISGNSSVGSNSTWVTYQTKTFTNSENYSTDYKTITLSKVTQSNANSSVVNNILSKTDSFDLRLYGTNYAANFPTVENRSLYFLDLSFVSAQAPSQPLFVSENAISSYNTITLNYKTEDTENGVSDSTAVLIEASNTYYDSNSLTSTVSGASVEYTSGSPATSVTTISDVTSDVSYPISISNLRAGTKYNFFTKARNDLTGSTTYSSVSSTRETEYTRLPSSTGASTASSSWFTASQSSTYNIMTPSTSWDGANLNGSSELWVNVNGSTTSQYVNVNYNTSRTIEISKPYSNNQQSTTTGYGKFIDNSENLVTMSAKINDILQHQVKFGGFGESVTNTTYAGVNTTLIFYGSNTSTAPTVSDQYSDNKRKGYRLNTSFKINRFSGSLLNPYSDTEVVDASKSAYSLSFEYDRHNDIGESDITVSQNFYVDDLSNPTISSKSSSAYVKTVSHCMGIPSVSTFDMVFSRSYSNINSSYGFCRKSSVGNFVEVGRIQSVSNTNRSSSSSNGKLIINRSDIVTSGDYSFTASDINSATNTNSRYLDIYLSSSTNSATTLTISDKAFNLNSTITESSTLSVNYFHDSNSYSDTPISTPNINAHNSKLYEISNITNSIFSDLSTISESQVSHTQTPKDWTLLYIDGGFKTNASFTYPNISTYTWTKENATNATALTYTAGSTEYALDGTTTGSGDKYKWIVFKYTESDSSSYSDGGATIDFFDVYTRLNSDFGFSSTTLGYLKDETESKVIGFIKQTVSSSVRIGNLCKAFNPNSAWYEQDGAVSYSTMTSESKYGTRKGPNNTSWGPILDKTNGENEIYLYIGFKNSVSVG